MFNWRNKSIDKYMTKANVNKSSTIKKIHVLGGYLCGKGHKEGNILSSFA